MHRSSMLARLVSIVIALVLTPTALILLSIGGTSVSRAFFSFGFERDLAPLIGPLLLQMLGVILVLAVIATGLWSSAGLIAIGILSVLPLAFAIFPGVLWTVYGASPREWGDGLIYGIPLSVVPVLGAMGLVLALVRRDPRPTSGALGAIGLVASPVLLAGAAWLTAWGVAEGSLLAFQRFQFDLRPDAALAMLGGLVLAVAGIVVARWSPYALLLPGIALLVGSALLLFASDAAFPVLVQLPRGVNMVVPTMLLYGGGAAVGLGFPAFTAVLLRVRARARTARTGQDAVAQPVPGYPAAPGHPGQYPAAPGYPGQYPPPPVG